MLNFAVEIKKHNIHLGPWWQQQFSNKKMKTTFNASEIYYAVATFNADPFCVETEEQANEILAEITEFGFEEITDEEDKMVALSRLELPEDTNVTVYRAGGCTFAIE